MSKYVDLPIGSQFGLLTVLERAPDKILPNGRHRGQFRCRCQCGNETVVDPTSLKNGSTKSCGCLHPGGKVGLKDLTGQTFGKLAVIERADDYVTPKGVHRVAWKCKCSCGREKVVTAISLSSGKTKSCGFCKHADIKVNKENIRLGSFATFEEAVAARKAAEEKYFGAYSYDNSIEAVPRVERDGEPVAALPEDAPISAEPFAGAESLATPLDAKVSEIDPAPMPTQASPISAQEALGHQPSALTKEESLMAQVQSHRIHSTGRSARPSSTPI